MNISGVGRVSKKNIFAILTSDGKAAYRHGTISDEELATMYKEYLIQKVCKIGSMGNTFSSNYARIPDTLKEKLTPEELADLVWAFYICYGDGVCSGIKNIPSRR